MLGFLTLIGFAAILLVLLLTVILIRGAQRPPRHTAGYAIARGMAVDPGDAGLPFEAWALDRPDGAVLPVWEIPASGVPGDQAPATPLTVILLHGWGQGRVDLLPEARWWHERGCRAVLLDLRGHGDAEGGPSWLGVTEDQDVRALLDRLGAGPFVLVGHSLGAVIAIHTAADSKEIAGVIAFAPYVRFFEVLRRRLRDRDLPARPMTDLARLWCSAVRRRPRPTTAAAAAVSCPLLIVHGTHDAIVPGGDARLLAGAAPDARVVSIRDGAHSGLFDAPEARAAMDEFARMIESRGPIAEPA